MTNSEYSDVTPQIHALAQKMTHNSVIDTDLYSKYNVKRGLRDLDGKGVLTGLTDISTITQNKLVDGKLVPCEGELRYRGYNVKDIVDGILEDDRFGFEEVTYLLLFGDIDLGVWTEGAVAVPGWIHLCTCGNCVVHGVPVQREAED